MGDQAALEGATRLDIECAIDRLVRDMHRRLVGIGVHEPRRDLLRRPVEPELLRDHAPQSSRDHQAAPLGPTRRGPGRSIRIIRSIARSSSMALNLATDRRRRTGQAAR